ncbi:transcription factor bHLH18-like [Asparagus officinalis]|uniref:transcription factor bHLH18-like n=1 Tax=Asparagus officinalis TaxID=4686 RepID=UPI00098E0A2A|nr:transcription factor bHLH18-like [Asparagus officinalis]
MATSSSDFKGKDKMSSTSYILCGFSDDYESSCDDNFEEAKNTGIEVKVKICEDNVLLNIHCRKSKGVLVKMLGEIESLKLSVITARTTPSEASELVITVNAQIEEGFSLTVKELVKKLNAALRRFISRTE